MRRSYEIRLRWRGRGKLWKWKWRWGYDRWWKDDWNCGAHFSLNSRRVGEVGLKFKENLLSVHCDWANWEYKDRVVESIEFSRWAKIAQRIKFHWAGSSLLDECFGQTLTW